jgi:hypothetical protein
VPGVSSDAILIEPASRALARAMAAFPTARPTWLIAEAIRR